MKLTDRKQRILRCLVARYIKTAQPVSSSDIQKDLEEDISSATIRSELAGLEEMGYLEQPHVSAGRIPTSQGYKMYVNSLSLVTNKSNKNHVQELKGFFDQKMQEVEDVVKSTAKVLSDVTNYTSVIVVKNVSNIVIRKIKLIDIGADSALLVVITDSGVIKDSFIDLPEGLGGGYLQTACDILNDLFEDKTVEEIRNTTKDIDESLAQYKTLLDSVLSLLDSLDSDNEVIVEGTAKLLDYPEYEDTGNAKPILSLIDHKKELSEMVTSGGIDLSVKIGKEEGVEHGSLVSVKYRIDDTKSIHAGVIGPERMDYKMVIGVLTHLEEAIRSITDKKED